MNRIDFNHAKVMPMILDVGCGCNPRGDVNINIDRSVPKQKLMPNFILADAQYLPLRDKCFSLVYASHVIEHVQDPLRALKEWNRVARTIEVYTPSAFDLDLTRGHIFTWNPHTFRNILSMVFTKINVVYTSKPTVIRGRVGKYFPILNLMLAKLGFRRELKALCSDSS